jgi:hypothetical protein
MFGLLFASIPSVLYAREFIKPASTQSQEPQPFHRYPSIDDEIVAEIVGASHFDLERVMELVYCSMPKLA